MIRKMLSQYVWFPFYLLPLCTIFLVITKHVWIHESAVLPSLDATYPSKCFQDFSINNAEASVTDPVPVSQWLKGKGGPPYYSSGVLEQRGFFTKLKAWGFDPKFILDVGANEGGWAKEVYNEFGGSTDILCVEGSSKRVPALDALGFDYVISLVGPKNMWAEFYDNDGWAHTGNSVLKERTSFYEGTKPTLTPMRTLDSLLTDYRDQTGRDIRPTLLKLDVQGFELEAFKGAIETLSTIEVLVIETSLLQYNEGSPLLGEVLITLDCLGFQVLEVLGLQRTGPQQVLIQVDFALIRKGSFLFDKATEGAGIH